jgi:hypothetical protein
MARRSLSLQEFAGPSVSDGGRDSVEPPHVTEALQKTGAWACAAIAGRAIVCLSLRGPQTTLGSGRDGEHANHRNGIQYAQIPAIGLTGGSYDGTQRGRTDLPR